MGVGRVASRVHGVWGGDGTIQLGKAAKLLLLLAGGQKEGERAGL